MSDELRLDGRVAVVTGAGRGLGRAHALLLAERGAAVVVNDLGGAREGGGVSSEPAAAVVEEITDSGGRAVASVTDISTPAGGEELIEAATTAFGQIDIVVNNAGIFDLPRPFVETSLETFERFWRVHFGGTYNVIRAAWPHFLRQRYGRVINTGSSAGFYGLQGANEYAAAKGAVHAFTASLALEAAEHGILVNGIGPVGATRMSQELFADPSVLTDDPEAANGIARHLRSELCSQAVVWLAHESCSSNGRIYQAHAGRVACVAIGEPEGFWDADLTPEMVRDHVDEVSSRDDLLFPTDAVSWASWALENSARRSRNGAVAQSAPAGSDHRAS